ncbi:MAG: glycosyltransferase [Flavobacterium sp.]|nr:MAG: glycosyltransferase [Flavobacterium sp.]
MRALQLIDSLDPGGAERIAVTFANSLSGKISYSALCTTRKEGLLKDSLQEKVDYIFLRKKGVFDIFSLMRLIKFVRTNDIEIIHAHSSSFFFGWILKIFRPKLKLIWHDHYGKSEQLSERKSGVLKYCSHSFFGIIAVNQLLKNWAEQNLHAAKVLYLKNFVTLDKYLPSEVHLEGTKNFRIVCLANFRRQKNHLNLIRAFEIVLEKQPQASLHLIGKPVDINYYENLRAYISENRIENVTLHGEQQNVLGLLSKCDIGVLASDSEGLPVALLEYGVAGLAVITTKVGECANVVNGYGEIVEAGNYKELAIAILKYIENKQQRSNLALAFQKHIKENYSADAVLPQLIAFYRD